MMKRIMLLGAFICALPCLAPAARPPQEGMHPSYLSGHSHDHELTPIEKDFAIWAINTAGTPDFWIVESFGLFEAGRGHNPNGIRGGQPPSHVPRIPISPSQRPRPPP